MKNLVEEIYACPCCGMPVYGREPASFARHRESLADLERVTRELAEYKQAAKVLAECVEGVVCDGKKPTHEQLRAMTLALGGQ